MYVQGSYSAPLCWQSSEEIGVTMKIGKENRLIIAHTGGEAALANDGLLIFKSSSTTGDNHTSMNFRNFSRRISGKILENILKISVVVMDASYQYVES